MVKPRDILKNAVESVLARSLGGARGARLMQGRTLVLAYHNLLPDGAAPVGDASLHLPRRLFAAQLDMLREHCDVIPLDELLEAHPAQGRPRVAITFDDAYHGAISLGVSELTRRGMPATIFVAPGLLNQKMLWWDELATRLPRERFEAERDGWLQELSGDPTRIRERFGPWQGVIEHVRTATTEELDCAASQPGITIGSHGWSHQNMGAIAGQQLEAELVESQDWLRSRYASFVPWLAYPYGLFSSEAAQQAGRVGYTGAFGISGGWLTRDRPDNMHELPRLNIPHGLSAHGFALRLSGFFC